MHWPAGIAHRNSANFDDRCNTTGGVDAGMLIYGPVVRGEHGIDYVVDQESGGLYVPLSKPDGTQLLKRTRVSVWTICGVQALSHQVLLSLALCFFFCYCLAFYVILEYILFNVIENEFYCNHAKCIGWWQLSLTHIIGTVVSWSLAIRDNCLVLLGYPSAGLLKHRVLLAHRLGWPIDTLRFHPIESNPEFSRRNGLHFMQKVWTPVNNGGIMSPVRPLLICYALNPDPKGRALLCILGCGYTVIAYTLLHSQSVEISSI